MTGPKIKEKWGFPVADTAYHQIIKDCCCFLDLTQRKSKRHPYHRVTLSKDYCDQLIDSISQPSRSMMLSLP